jgi:hypothetical protein
VSHDVRDTVRSLRRRAWRDAIRVDPVGLLKKSDFLWFTRFNA